MKINKRKYKPRNPIAKELHQDPQFNLKVKSMKKREPKPITVNEATKIIREENEK